MSLSLSTLVNNLSENIHNDGKCTSCNSFLDYISVKTDKLLFECFDCTKRYSRKFNKKLINKFKKTYEFLIKSLINLCFY